jgi:hypothetical protein
LKKRLDTVLDYRVYHLINGSFGSRIMRGKLMSNKTENKTEKGNRTETPSEKGAANEAKAPCGCCGGKNKQK